MSNLQLAISGEIFTGWKTATLVYSLEQLAHTFEVSLSERWENKIRPIKTGEPVTIKYKNQVVLTGYVDDVFPSYDHESHEIVVSGRSKTSDLVDCSSEAKQWHQRTLLQLADEVCLPFDIEVLPKADVGKAFKTIQIEAGETYFEFLEQAARIRAVRLVTDSEGNLVITRKGTKVLETSLVLGNNILQAQCEFTLRDRFSDYTVIGQSDGDDQLWGANVAALRGTATDNRLRHRPMVINADGAVDAADCKRRARWHRNVVFGRSQSIVYTVNGWEHSAGIWQPNDQVRVKDVFMGIDDLRLISGVTLTLDDSGEKAQIQVMPPEAFDLVELPEPVSDAEVWS